MRFARIRVGEKGKPTQAAFIEGAWHEIQGDIFGEWQRTGTVFEGQNVRFLAPLIPKQIYGIGKNFIALGELMPAVKPELPIFFLKPVSSVIGPEDSIIVPEGLSEVKFEAEIAVVIGKPAYRVQASEAMDVVLGFTIANDVTAPQRFHSDGHWTLGKAAPTFTPLGPWIETELDVANARVQATLNGKVHQDSPTSSMILNVSEVVSSLSAYVALMPGDVILSGSPAGASFIRHGDVIECVVTGLGSLSNPVLERQREERV